MSGIFTQLYMQFIFAVENADCLISKDWSDKLNKQISSILKDHGHKPIIVNGSHDHVHVFFVLNPNISATEAASIIKKESADFVNKSGFVKKQFNWQEGYGAFTYSKIRTNDVYLYITHQDRYIQNALLERSLLNS